MHLLKAGRVAPVCLALVILGLTLGEMSYLREVGWSPIHRTRTEWPSLLELGPGGWLLTASFVLAGLFGVVVGRALWQRATRQALRAASVLFVATSCALILVAFSPDQSRSRGHSWHAEVHNLAYLVLLFAGLTSAALFALTPAAGRAERRLRLASMVALPVLGVGVAVTNLDSVAQLGRYLIIGGLIGWAQIAAHTAATLGEM